MLGKSLFFLFMIFAIELFSVNTMAEDSTVGKEVPVFTNKDIEKYKLPSDNQPSIEKKDKAAGKREKSSKIKNDKDKEYWCKKATSHRNKIEKADNEVKRLEQELSAENEKILPDNKKTKTLEKKLTKANIELKGAEEKLINLEDEAHRKEIPPGWLRCQFE